MATKIIINIEDGLTREEMNDLPQLLVDAVSSFAVTRTPPAEYVERRYAAILDAIGISKENKIAQVTQRVALASKLYPNMHSVEFVHAGPHVPTPVFEYYTKCDEEDLNAMAAALDFLPAAQFGERKGWVVVRDQGILVIVGPDDQRAFWNEAAGKWMWLEDGDGPVVVQ